MLVGGVREAGGGGVGFVYLVYMIARLLVLFWFAFSFLVGGWLLGCLGGCRLIGWLADHT